MKLARKFTLTLLAGMCAVLAVSGYTTIQREVSLFQTDTSRDHALMGGKLALAVSEIWTLSGPERALRFVEEVSRREDTVRVRWIGLEDPYAPPPFHLGTAEAVQLRKGEPVSMRTPGTAEGPGFQRTYVTVRAGGVERGVLELSETLAEEERYVRTTLLRTVLMTVAIVVVSGLLAVGLGAWFVGRPVHALMEKARRVGAGDLSGRLALRQRDELSELGGELDAMCDRLRDAQARIAEETAARISTIEQLRHADRLMTVGKLASGIAHELGTPLNVVWAQANMISSGEVAGEEVPSTARVIAEQSQRMTAIIRQLLDFARPHTPRKARVDLGDLAARTLRLLEPMAEKRKVELALRCQEPVWAEVDPEQIQQVLSNLVMNGIQAMTSGGRLEVEMGRARARAPADRGGGEEECIRISVADEGAGIRDEDLHRIFEPFFTTKEVGEGTGLGLSVSSGIVREHGGWMEVRSRVGEGSCFSVCFPVRKAGCAA
jgi:two-component system, NtrC family, sensor kinase